MGEDEGQGPPTPGQRVYLIREALGTRRDAMPLDQFAALIQRTTGAVYDTSILSRMETGKRKVSLEDIDAIAPVDPKKRGKAWLAGWDDEAEQPARETVKPPAPILDPPAPVPPLEMFREIQTGDDLRRALGEPTKKKRRGNGDDVG